jgi:hypothetical protein
MLWSLANSSTYLMSCLFLEDTGASSAFFISIFVHVSSETATWPLFNGADSKGIPCRGEK